MIGKSENLPGRMRKDHSLDDWKEWSIDMQEVQFMSHNMEKRSSIHP
jgi:hypothetical protein